MDARIVLVAPAFAAQAAFAFDHHHAAWGGLLARALRRPRRLDACRADGVPHQCLQRLHGGEDPAALSRDPFKDEFFSLFGRKASLDWIEHETLRKNYRDPRIHYAVNCASISCPMLRAEPYVAVRLDAQLEDQARRFLSDPSRNRYRGGRLEVSKIFDWYKEDFEPRDPYFARYAALIAFLDYDWALNDSPSSSRR